jgi:hypothetical protein
MSNQEQQEVKEKYYYEAIRYMDNAKDALKKAGKEDNFYKDVKYVKTACGIAYSGVLLAIDGYLLIKGVEKKKGRKSIDFYQSSLTMIDKKLLNSFNATYESLHLAGYYDGTNFVPIVVAGFNEAYEIIKKIKP